MNTQAPQRRVVIAAEKITKGEIDKTLAEGKTHVKFKNKGVQKRMMKQQQQIRRKQELRENQTKALAKAREAAKGTRPVGGGIGLAPGQTFKKSGDAHFISKDGKRVDVSAEQAAEVVKAFESTEGDEEDLTGAPGPEYRYLQQDEAEALNLNRNPDLERGKDVNITVTPIASPELVMDRAGNMVPEHKRDYENTWEGNQVGVGFKITDAFGGMGVIAKIEGEELPPPPAEVIVPVDGHTFSAEINVATTSSPSVGEDGVLSDSILAEHLGIVELNPFAPIIEPSRKQMFGARDIESGTEEASIGRNTMPVIPLQRPDLKRGQYPINLYGDENKYKPFPEIGEYVRDDGLYGVIRTFDEGTEPTVEELTAIRTPDLVFDKCLYTTPGAKVVDLSEEGRNNVEAMRAGLEKAGLRRKPTEQ